ncbi:MAG TPA: alpha/beta fold hydrolase [Candidatus Dormibacteraeota bacterium]
MTTFVLVHGHWHGAWCWSRLIPELEAAGHRCIAIELPCTQRDAGVAENARVIEAALEGTDDDVVLVGHSAGGLTIPLVAQHRPVRHLAFLAALLPIPGMSLGQQFDEDPSIIDPDFQYIDDGDGFCSIDPTLAPRYFYQDCDTGDAAWATARLRPQTTLTITEATPLQEWPATPRSYIIGDLDRVVRPEWAVRAARERLGVEALVLKGVGHSPFVSQPGPLASHLSKLASGQFVGPGATGA